MYEYKNFVGIAKMDNCGDFVFYAYVIDIYDITNQYDNSMSMRINNNISLICKCFSVNKILSR